MPIVFIAVQCFHCSTMQVKQQKKSSNKWNCVVCNEKQSVRKVFSQGFIAKDVRKFVQSFNMSRQFADENAQETLVSPLEETVDPCRSSYSRYEGKRRNDWSEYLDAGGEDDDNEEERTTGELEPIIVTELPREMFKKPKLSNSSAGLNNSQGRKSYSPIFRKRKTSTPDVPRGKIFNGVGTQISKQNELLPEELRKAQTERQGASKWKQYITQDDDELFSYGGTDSPDLLQPWEQGGSGIGFNDQRVEEDVHPDFI